jgi:hypothetical protein
MSKLDPFQIYCAECGLPVDLEEAKTNADSKAVHERCYVHQLRADEQRNDERVEPLKNTRTR